MDGRVEREFGARAVGVFSLSLAAAWLPILAYAIHAGLPFNPVRLPWASRVQARGWAPEGWAFFTRNPQEESLHVFVRDGEGGWRGASLGANASASQLFGLKRQARVQGMESGLLMTELRRFSWDACREASVTCLERAQTGGPLVNRSPNPTLCGTLGFVLQRPLPWAWLGARDRIVMPSRVVRAEVQC